jgi:hypothetical protein
MGSSIWRFALFDQCEELGIAPLQRLLMSVNSMLHVLVTFMTEVDKSLKGVTVLPLFSTVQPKNRKLRRLLYSSNGDSAVAKIWIWCCALHWPNYSTSFK